MALTPGARLFDAAGRVRTAGPAERAHELTPEDIDAAIAAVAQRVHEPGFGAAAPIPHTGQARQPVMSGRQLLLGGVILIGAIVALVAGIVLTNGESSNSATAARVDISRQAVPGSPPRASGSNAIDAAKGQTAAPSPAATVTVPSNASGAEVPAGFTRAVSVSTPAMATVSGMPEAAPGFENAWLVAPGQTCSDVVGAGRPQELVENANPGLNTGPRCANLPAGTWLCRDNLDRVITGTPACIGAVRVTNGLVLTWGTLDYATTPAISVAMAVRANGNIMAAESIAETAAATAHGACFFALGAVGELAAPLAVVEMAGAPGPVVVDLGTIASTVAIDALPPCTVQH